MLKFDQCAFEYSSLLGAIEIPSDRQVESVFKRYGLSDSEIFKLQLKGLCFLCRRKDFDCDRFPMKEMFLRHLRRKKNTKSLAAQLVFMSEQSNVSDVCQILERFGVDDSRPESECLECFFCKSGRKFLADSVELRSVALDAMVRLSKRFSDLKWNHSFIKATSCLVSLIEDTDSSLRERAGSFVEECFGYHPMLKMNAQEEQSINRDNSLALAGVVCVCVVRNELPQLPSFLKHYRGLGVRKFIFINNNSTDGSLEYLENFDDISLVHKTESFSESGFGQSWIEEAIRSEAVGQWVLVSDADERFVFEQFESRSLSEFVKSLEERQIFAIQAPLVDVFPAKALSDFRLEGQDDLLKNDLFFRSQPLKELLINSGPFSNSSTLYSSFLLEHGPQFAVKHFIANKTPLFKSAPFVHLSEGAHHLSGYDSIPLLGAMLHFKFHANSLGNFSIEISRKEHADQAQKYVQLAQLFNEGFIRSENVTPQKDLTKLFKSLKVFTSADNEG